MRDLPSPVYSSNYVDVGHGGGIWWYAFANGTKAASIERFRLSLVGAGVDGKWTVGDEPLLAGDPVWRWLTCEEARVVTPTP